MTVSSPSSSTTICASMKGDETLACLLSCPSTRHSTPSVEYVARVSTAVDMPVEAVSGEAPLMEAAASVETEAEDEKEDNEENKVTGEAEDDKE